ncbi:hypothetical protein PENTCL1PPCAC_4578, partial [Pristionchus entomophagus]
SAEELRAPQVRIPLPYSFLHSKEACNSGYPLKHTVVVYSIKGRFTPSNLLYPSGGSRSGGGTTSSYFNVGGPVHRDHGVNDDLLVFDHTGISFADDSLNLFRIEYVCAMFDFYSYCLIGIVRQSRQVEIPTVESE